MFGFSGLRLVIPVSVSLENIMNSGLCLFCRCLNGGSVPSLLCVELLGSVPGFTINAARPAAWFIFIGIIGSIVALSIIASVLL